MWFCQLVWKRIGTIPNTSRKIEGDRRREEIREQSFISVNSSMPVLAANVRQPCAKTGILNLPGICWHDGTPYAHVWHAVPDTHTVLSQ